MDISDHHHSPEASDGDLDTCSSSSSSSSTGGVSIAAASIPSPSESSGGVHYEDDEEDEGDVCRICRNPGEAENPLRYPCACSGSIKYVHQDCLLQWLNHSGALQCEGFTFLGGPI